MHKFLILAVLDNRSRNFLRTIADVTVPSGRVGRAGRTDRGPWRVLLGIPRQLQGEHPRSMLDRTDNTKLAQHHIDSGKTRQNAFVQAFSGALRDDHRTGSTSKGSMTKAASRSSGDTTMTR
jgi:hypothetical protein